MEMSFFKNLHHCFEVTSCFCLIALIQKLYLLGYLLKKGNLVAAASIKKIKKKKLPNPDLLMISLFRRQPRWAGSWAPALAGQHC